MYIVVMYYKTDHNSTAIIKVINDGLSEVYVCIYSSYNNITINNVLPTWVKTSKEIYNVIIIVTTQNKLNFVM